jgi:hypothetical protein
VLLIGNLESMQVDHETGSVVVIELNRIRTRTFR